MGGGQAEEKEMGLIGWDGAETEEYREKEETIRSAGASEECLYHVLGSKVIHVRQFNFKCCLCV